MTHPLERYLKTSGDGPSATIGLEDWNGVLDAVGNLLVQLVQKGADFDAVSATVLGVLLDRINAVLSPAYDQVALRGAQVEALYARLNGEGVSAAAVIETADRLFLTTARHDAIITDALAAVRGGVDGAGDTLAKLYAIARLMQAGIDANTSGLSGLGATVAAQTALLATGFASLDTVRALAIQVAQQQFGTVALPDGFVEDFGDPSFIDPASTGYYLDASAGQVVGGVGGQTLFADGTPAFESYPSLPPMASATTTTTSEAGYVASTNGPGTAYTLFNRPTGGFTDTGTGGTTYPLIYKLQVPNPIIVGGYAIATNSASGNTIYPNAWTYEASTDDVTYDVLDSRSGQTFNNAAGERKVFAIPAAKLAKYKFFRWVITGITSTLGQGGRMILNEFSPLLSISGAESQSSIPKMTGPTSVVGGASGYAATGTGSSPNQTGYEPWRAADGVRNLAATSSGFGFHSGGSTGTWTLQLPSGIKVLVYRIASLGGSYSPLAWQVRVSDTNNGSDWAVIDSRTVGSNFWSATIGDWHYFVVKVPVSSKFLNLNITSTPDYARLAEIEFLQGSSGNMDLRSKPYTRNAGVPSKASITLDLKINAGVLSLNTNVKARVSRNAGGSFKDVALSLVGPIGNGLSRYQSPPTDLSDQPADNRLVSQVLLSGGIGANLDAIICLGAT